VELLKGAQKDLGAVLGTESFDRPVDELELLLVEPDADLVGLTHEGAPSIMATASISTRRSGLTRLVIPIVELTGGSTGKYRARDHHR
jgi:hypothetical protein